MMPFALKLIAMLLLVNAASAQSCASDADCAKIPCPFPLFRCEPGWCSNGTCMQPICIVGGQSPAVNCPVRELSIICPGAALTHCDSENASSRCSNLRWASILDFTHFDEVHALLNSGFSGLRVKREPLYTRPYCLHSSKLGAYISPSYISRPSRHDIVFY